MGPNKSSAADKRRYLKLKKLGCICCRRYGIKTPAQIHHITVARKRLGNEFTIPLCAWHHQGMPFDSDMRPSAVTGVFGPSLALSKRLFIAEFGTELELLDEVNELLQDDRNLIFEQEVHQ
ncbi:MAG: Ref family recombination enhancement nuclease [Pseudomonadota bacterium]